MGRMKRRKEKTKQTIMEAAIKLIQADGFDETSMEQIARAADVAKGTLYNYFPAKEAIVSEWVRRTSYKNNQARLRALPGMPDTRARMMAVFEAYVEGVRAQKELFEKFVIYQMQQLVSFEQTNKPMQERSGLAFIGQEIVRLGQESGELRRDLPDGVLADMFEVVFIEIVKQFYKNPATFQAREVIEQLVDLFLKGAQNHGSNDNA